MKCPYCGTGRNRVKGGKTFLEDENADGRVRECLGCGGEFLTAESVTHIIDANAGPKRVQGWTPVENAAE